MPGGCAVGAKVPADMRVLEIFSSTFRADQVRLALERLQKSAGEASRGRNGQPVTCMLSLRLQSCSVSRALML